jgi:two-component system CheB/CheR fusion protein
MDAVLRMMNMPIILMGTDQKVRNANEAFTKLFQLDPGKVSAQSVFEIGRGMFDKPALRTLLEETLTKTDKIKDVEIEDTFGNLGYRKLRINARRFAEDPGGMEVILLTLEDVTRR